MPIFTIDINRKRLQKSFISLILSVVIMLLMVICYPGSALAGGVGDVVTKVANSNYQSPEFEFGAEKVTGYGFQMHAGYGGYGNGYGGVSVLGPVDASDMSILLSHVDSEAQHTSIQTTKLKGCEVREYTMADGIGVGVILPDYFITVETYQSGNSSTAEFQKAKSIAQQVLDGLESNGLLSQPAPEIEKPSEENNAEEKPAETVPATSSVVTGKPLDEPAPIANTDNIYAVKNGPTAPTTFTVNSPHLVTFARNYHWNSAKGATPGLIGFKDQNGKVYGPWQATGKPGQGGVPNAYWEVYPNIVIPAGTYTITDSDPATWSCNSQSGGIGMSQVHATPNFEVKSGSLEDLTEKSSGRTSGSSENTESPAGVGSIGNIPGPSNTTEAVVGVAVPGLIAAGLGALAGMGGGGGFVPPGGTPLSPNSGGPASGTGGAYPGQGTPGTGTPGSGTPGSGTRTTGTVQDISQLGRRKRPDIIVDTAEMSREPIIGPANEAKIIETADEAAVLVQTEPGIIIDTAEMGQGAITMPGTDGPYIETADEAAIFVQPDSAMIIDTTDDAGVFIQTEQIAASPMADAADAEILIDTSALDNSGPSVTYTAESGGEAGSQTVAAGTDSAGTESQMGDQNAGQDYDKDLAGAYDESGFDSEGYDRDGYNREGFDKEGFNKAGFDAEGYDKEGFNQSGFNKEGYNREGFDKTGYDQEGFNKEGFDKSGFDKEGFNKAGFDAEGYDKEGFNQSGFNKEGYNREGFDKTGYDQEGFNKEGFDKSGFDKEGFNKGGFDVEGYDKEGFNQSGFDKEGFNREGFDKTGYDQEGFNKEGFDRSGYDKEGFNKAGFDREGYGRNGFNSEGFDREGFDVNGYNAKGYNRGGYNAKGYNAAGYDKEGFDKDGWDQEGFGRDGLNKDGFDREGYDKAGYDKDGYNRDGYDREGRQQEGYDAEGYDKKGFNKDGFDRDGYDRDGFNYEGYNRAGYDPWGYDKQGYGKDGYHWSGYNADGYNKVGMHWTDNPYDGDSPFNVDTRNPFDGGTVIIDQDNYGNKVDLAGSWKPTKPPLGEPYPKTLEKYGAKPWTDEPQAPEPVTNSDISKPDVKDDTGFVPGPEDPQGTLEHHDPSTGNAAQTPEDSSAPENIPSNTFTYTDPETGETTTYEYGEGYTGPRQGDTQILVGKADGQTYELKFDAVKGKWINTESGNEFNPDDFERWQNDLAVDKARAAEDLEKMAARQDANSKAIDKNLEDWHKLEQMQKAADKYNIGEHNGPGDVDKAIQELKDAMLEGKELDQEKMDKIRRVIDNRILGKTTADTGERWEEDWFKNLGWALEANAATAKEVLTGEKDDGSISWLGMGARIMITVATGGLAGAGSLAPVVMDGGLTVAEAMYRIKDSIDKGESDFRAISKAVGMVILGEEIGWLAGKTGGKMMGEMLERFPVFTNKAADFLERGLLKIMKADLMTSRGLGMISKESAEETLKQLEKRLTELGGDAAEEAMEKAAKGVGKAVSGSGDDIAKGSSKIIGGSGDDIAKGSGKAVSESSGNIAKGSGKATSGSGGDEISKGVSKAASGSSDDIVKGAGKAANTGSDDIAKGTGKGTSAGPDVQDGTGKTPFGKKDDIAPGTGKTTSDGDGMAEGTRKTASGGDGSKRSDGSEGIGGKTGAGGPDGPDGPGKPPSKESGDAADAAGKAPGTDEGTVKTGPVTSSLPEVNDYYSQPGKNAEIDSYAHINMDMERLRETMKGNHLAAGESGAVYAAPPKAGVPAYEFTNTTTVRISDQNLVDVRIRTGPGGQTQYVTPRGEIIDPATLKDKVLMTPAPEGTGMVLTYYDPQGNIRSYIPAKFMERWSDAVKGFVPMG